MKKVAPLFNEILENNKLIKGRLTCNKSDLEKLYLALEKDINRLKKTQAHQEEVIKSNITKRNKISSQIKRNSESIKKSFYPSTNKISLIYKKHGESHYVKARFYWGGKQREVQVGSIPKVIGIINSMIANNLFPSMKKIRVEKLTWEQIYKRSILINAIKEIASIKAQEYIIRRLMQDKLIIIDKMDENIREDDNTLDISEIKLTHDKHGFFNDEDEESMEGIEWYKKWRRDNL